MDWSEAEGRGAPDEEWVDVCDLEEIVPDTGVCALLAG